MTQLDSPKIPFSLLSSTLVSEIAETKPIGRGLWARSDMVQNTDMVTLDWDYRQWIQRFETGCNSAHRGVEPNKWIRPFSSPVCLLAVGWSDVKQCHSTRWRRIGSRGELLAQFEEIMFTTSTYHTRIERTPRLSSPTDFPALLALTCSFSASVVPGSYFWWGSVSHVACGCLL
jgi:hypothetical protein